MSNKPAHTQKNLWRDDAKEAVRKARAEESARPQEDRAKIGKREFLLQRAHELLKLASMEGHEFQIKEFWVRKMILGTQMYAQQRQDVPVIAPRFEAWPVEGEIPEWVSKRFADERWLWNALALPLQHAISGIRDQQKEAVAAIYKQVEAEGLDTKDAEVRKNLSPKIKSALKMIDYSSLKRIEQARRTVLQEADLIRHGKIKDPDAEIQRLGWNAANWNFALAISKLPAWLQRLVQTRLDSASKARRTRRQAAASEAWFKGYPRSDLDDRSGEGGLDIYFNGQNLAWCSGEMKNSYLRISPAWNPPDHRGPRTGKYRSLREMRKITLREPESSGKNQFSLNTLFHSVPEAARMKGCKLRAKKDPSGKIHWHFIPTFELIAATAPEQRTFAGVDVGWRKSGEEAFAVAHSWDDTCGYRPWRGRIADNRWSRRYNARQISLPEKEQFPINMTPEGLRDFASRKDSLLRDLKTRTGDVLKNAGLLPANWERIGRRGISRMITDPKKPEFAALQCLRSDYDIWNKRDQELSRIYQTAWKMVSDNLDRQRRETARAILANITDVGIEALGVKEMAETENEGATNWERHIENIQDRSRQLTGPAKFLSILLTTARKMGKRVHQIAPRYTSRQCSKCRHVNQDLSWQQRFQCAGCGQEWNRDENAARNLQRLARECASADTQPWRCSRDGKHMPFHGVGAPAADKGGQRTDGDSMALAGEPGIHSGQYAYKGAVAVD